MPETHDVYWTPEIQEIEAYQIEDKHVGKKIRVYNANGEFYREGILINYQHEYKHSKKLALTALLITGYIDYFGVLNDLKVEVLP